MTVFALLKPFLPYLAALAALLGLGAYVRHDARSDERTKQKVKQAEAYAETRKKADEADIVGDSPNLAREWLREFHKRNGGL